MISLVVVEYDDVDDEAQRDIFRMSLVKLLERGG